MRGMDDVIEPDNCCFCCGKDNARGLRMSITHPGTGMAESTLEVPEWFSGWKSVTHGGLLATLLDEIMAHACMGTARTAVTGEITVRYKKPVQTGARIRAVGRMKETRGRIIVTEGWIYGADGEVAAEATARFVARPGARS
jgi:uncharacterized protein (TIGR00369 family)